MRVAANFAFCNRQLIAHRVREVFARHVGRDHALRLVYDVGHNTAKIESHGGRECIARARPARSGRRTPSSPRTTAVSGSRSSSRPAWAPPRTCCSAPTKAEARSLVSVCHGAGRVLARGAANEIGSGLG
jgi:tRNA-splicing ligase RtcB